MGVQGHPQLHSETTWAMLYGQSICKYILSLGLISRNMGLGGKTGPNFYSGAQAVRGRL